jgi:hypothetical protein
MNTDKNINFKSFQLLQGERPAGQEPIIGLRITDLQDSSAVYPMTADEAVELGQLLVRGAAVIYKQLGKLEDIRAQLA